MEVAVKLQISLELWEISPRQLDIKIVRREERSGVFLKKAKIGEPCQIPYWCRGKQIRAIIWHHKGKPTCSFNDFSFSFGYFGS